MQPINLGVAQLLVCEGYKYTSEGSSNEEMNGGAQVSEGPDNEDTPVWEVVQRGSQVGLSWISLQHQSLASACDIHTILTIVIEADKKNNK